MAGVGGAIKDVLGTLIGAKYADRVRKERMEHEKNLILVRGWAEGKLDPSEEQAAIDAYESFGKVVPKELQDSYRAFGQKIFPSLRPQLPTPPTEPAGMAPPLSSQQLTPPPMSGAPAPPEMPTPPLIKEAGDLGGQGFGGPPSVPLTGPTVGGFRRRTPVEMYQEQAPVDKAKEEAKRRFTQQGREDFAAWMQNQPWWAQLTPTQQASVMSGISLPATTASATNLPASIPGGKIPAGTKDALGNPIDPKLSYRARLSPDGTLVYFPEMTAPPGVEQQRLDTAYASYAAKLNKPADQLTPQEKVQAEAEYRETTGQMPLYPVMTGGAGAVYAPRSEAKGRAAPFTFFGPEGLPSTGGQAGVSRFPPMPITAETRNELAAISNVLKITDKVKVRLPQIQSLLGPVWGRVANVQLTKLGGLGLSKEQSEGLLWLKVLLLNRAFADGGKMLTGIEKGIVMENIPLASDTLQVAMQKADIVHETLSSKKAYMIQYLTPDQRMRIIAEGERTGGLTAPPVQMKAPDGTTRMVPPDQVEHYKSRGAVVVQ